MLKQPENGESFRAEGQRPRKNHLLEEHGEGNNTVAENLRTRKFTVAGEKKKSFS